MFYFTRDKETNRFLYDNRESILFYFTREKKRIDLLKENINAPF